MTHEISCPGKINLFLDVTGKTENGYHEILTLFLPVQGVEDKLIVEDADLLSISCNNSQVPTNSSNLCWKAAELFAKAAGIDPNWSIKLEKNLPVAGGMGGGSSNAGRLLSLLDLMFPGKVSESKLKEIALSIGADVPFFLKPQPSIATGVGEKLTPLQTTNKIPILLVTFSFPISAAWSYKNRKLPFHNSKVNFEELRNSWEQGEYSKIVYNDLGLAVAEKFPIIKNALGDLKKFGAEKAIVSGSGPTVFGVFEDANSRDQAMKALTEAGYPQENLITAFSG